MLFLCRLISSACLVLCLTVSPVWAQAGQEPEAIQDRITRDQISLVDCYAHACGLTFKCNPQWKVRVVDEYSTIITISTEPFVTMAISRIDSEIKLLGQLTKSFFQDKKIYSDNFQKGYVSFGGKDAIELKAFSKFEPRMRYLGYFFVDENGLNSVFFAVYPKEHWDDYKFFIKELAGTFQRI